jgi:transglutaminase-like putative cysteine protease
MARPLKPAAEAAPRAQDEQRGLLAVPPEGLASILAVLAMVFVLGLAVDQAAWVGHVAGTRTTQTSFLPLAMVVAAIVGGVLARLPIGALRAHLVGSIVGGLFLVNAVAGAISSAPGLEDRLRMTTWSVNNYAWESFVLGIRSHETSVFLLLVGTLLWAAAQLGSFNVFRRQRPLPLIVIGATALLLNMTLTTQEQLLHLVVFAAGAMLLVMRLNLLQEQVVWRSRRLADITQAGELFLSRGAAFIGLAVVMSVVLAGTASSAPLSRAWRDMDSRLLDFGYEVNRWLGGVSGPIRGSANLFGPTQTLRDVWESSTEPVFTAMVADTGAYYWRGATYDSFDGRTWQQLDALANGVAPGAPVFGGTAEALSQLKGRRQIAVSVTSHSLGGDVVVVPESPLLIDRATELVAHRGEGGFVTLRLSEGIREGSSYGAIALVPQDTGSEQVTASQLAAAGTDYEAWLARYLEIRPGAVGQSTYEAAARIVEALPEDRRNPYHIAEAIQYWFWRDGGFSYTTDVSGQCTGENLVDCFLEVRAGFCERFATAMTMMLRTQGIPARYVVGYLPGQELEPGTWLVDRSASHAWVEVYFPGYGWYRFDPTPGNEGNGQQPTSLAEGAPTPGPRGSIVPPPLPPDRIVEEPEGTPNLGPLLPVDQAPGANGAGLTLPFVLVVLLLVSAAVVVFSVGLRRRGPMEAARAYDGLTRLATRLGHGPKPTQTVFEYTGGLARLVPAASSDLKMLAMAKVESAYARRTPSWALGHRLGLAYRRVRLNLLRLVLRRPDWLRSPSQIRRNRSR